MKVSQGGGGWVRRLALMGLSLACGTWGFGSIHCQPLDLQSEGYAELQPYCKGFLAQQQPGYVPRPGGEATFLEVLEVSPGQNEVSSLIFFILSLKNENWHGLWASFEISVLWLF